MDRLWPIGSFRASAFDPGGGRMTRDAQLTDAAEAV